MDAMIEARTGNESHGSNWGKFYIHGLELVAEGYSRDRHENYRDSVAKAADGTIFSIWDTMGDKHGTKSGDYYICIADSSANTEIAGGCYGISAWCDGAYRVIAHGDGKVRAPRMLEWVKKLGGIENVTPELAAKLEMQIHERGRKDFSA